MIKTRVALGFAAMMTLLALTATPAAATFTNRGGRGNGVIGIFVFTYESGDVTCTGGTGDTYTVNATGTAETLENIKWEKCKSPFGPTTTVTLKTKEQKQPNKEGTEKGSATGAIVESGTISSGGCVITIGTEGNKELKSIALTKSGLDLISKEAIGGITATTNGNIACSLGGASKTKTTAAKSASEYTLEGVGLE